MRWYTYTHLLKISSRRTEASYIKLCAFRSARVLNVLHRKSDYMSIDKNRKHWNAQKQIFAIKIEIRNVSATENRFGRTHWLTYVSVYPRENSESEFSRFLNTSWCRPTTEKFIAPPENYLLFKTTRKKTFFCVFESTFVCLGFWEKTYL